MPDYSRRNFHGDPYLTVGDRVAFDETYWDDQGVPFLFGSVIGRYYGPDDHVDPRTGEPRERVVVAWDDGETTYERADQTGGGAFHAPSAECYWHKF